MLLENEFEYGQVAEEIFLFLEMERAVIASDDHMVMKPR
jgi:hypothetical protein